MQKIGIFSWFSYDLPIKERFRLIKNAGFVSTSLWWDSEDMQLQPDMARKIGLEIDNVHAPYSAPKYSPNSLWLDEPEGDVYLKMLISCVEDCSNYEIPTVVIHLSRSRELIEATELGLQRLENLVEIAEKRKIKLAFENLRCTEYLDTVFQHFDSQYVGFCYDSGHENLNRERDCLSLYSSRLFALHLDDNYGDSDTHLLPLDGNIDWKTKMKQLRTCKEVEYFTLEVDFDRNHDKSKKYLQWSAEEFLQSAYQKATVLQRM